MKTTCFLFALWAAAFAEPRAFGQTTAITYQGRLQHGGAPANGFYEMSFTLYDTVTNGNIVVGWPITVAPVPVSNGLFTATLNMPFAASSFDGANRWLEIAVTVFGSDQPVVTLVPRQPITAAPYAVHAGVAEVLRSRGSVPLDILVNGQRALRLEEGTLSPNVIGGAGHNYAAGGVMGATIAGGGMPEFTTPEGATVPNRVLADFGTVGGGVQNTSGARASTVCGGELNSNDGVYGTIGGGRANTIFDATASTVGGGERNTILGPTGGGTISGGVENVIQDEASGATIGGGWFNLIANIAGNSTIGGGWANHVAASQATIGGGESNAVRVLDAHYATVGGGLGNQVWTRGATIGGGEANRIERDRSGAGGPMTHADYATIAGGRENVVKMGAESAAIGGGSANVVERDALNATIGGGWRNTVESNATYATIGGGLFNTAGAGSATVAGGAYNNATWQKATVGGGWGNNALGDSATIAGGEGNYSTGGFSTVCGGQENRATGAHSAIGGGLENSVRAAYSIVAGGLQNHVETNAYYSFIPGGANNLAAGRYTFAAGHLAQELHDGAFVWADMDGSMGHDPTPFASQAANEFAVRATGGARFVSAVNTSGSNIAGVTLAPGSGTWSSLSDRDAKENFSAANGREILDKVTALPLASWNYKAQDKSIRHLGPTAQDFHAAFGLGESDLAITTVDADGVALAAIQGLNARLQEELKERDARIRKLEQRLESLAAALNLNTSFK